MKKFFLLLTLALIFTGCGKSSTDHVYSGKVLINSLNVSGTAPTATAPALMLSTALSTSLSDTLDSTITTTFQGGDISISANATAWLEGSITNDTPNIVQGFWYCPMMLPGVIGQEPDGSVGYWGDTITIAPGNTYTFQGGITFSGSTYHIVPGPLTWTVHFFDTTADPNAPTIGGGILPMISYGSTTTPRAIGKILFNIIP